MKPLTPVIALLAAFACSSTLASDMGFEFLISGKPFEESKGTTSKKDMEKYRAAIETSRRTPCYETSRDEPSRLIWDNIKTTHQLEVCVFRAADSLKNQSKLIQMLVASGFARPFVVEQPGKVARFKGIDGKSFVITATMPTKNLPRGFGGFFERLFSYGFGIGVTLDEIGKPYHVSTSFNKE